MKTGHEVGGIILFVFFLVAALSALEVFNNCTNSALATNLTGALPCSDGYFAMGVAVLFLVIAIVLFATGGDSQPSSSQIYLIPQGAPAAPPTQPSPLVTSVAPLPPPLPMVACPGCRRVYQLGQFRHCPNCGGKLD